MPPPDLVAVRAQVTCYVLHGKNSSLPWFRSRTGVVVVKDICCKRGVCMDWIHGTRLPWVMLALLVGAHSSTADFHAHVDLLHTLILKRQKYWDSGHQIFTCRNGANIYCCCTVSILCTCNWLTCTAQI
jgi:hypothetical protein